MLFPFSYLFHPFLTGGQIPITPSIYDRNFASFRVIYEHDKRGLPFLIRCKLTANNVVKDFVKKKAKSAIVKFE